MNDNPPSDTATMHRILFGNGVLETAVRLRVILWVFVAMLAVRLLEAQTVIRKSKYDTVIVNGRIVDGAFPRVLGRYVRERGVLKLEDAIRKMTSLNAAKVGLLNRGLLKPGYFADITLFDPQKVIDRADYTDPFHYNEGIEYVIVNGKVVLERGAHTGVQPGRVLRHSR